MAGAFTLAELVTALAVTSVAVTVLLGVMREGSEGYGRVRDGAAGRVEARAALHLAAEDASTLVPALPVTVAGGGRGWDFAGGRFESWAEEGAAGANAEPDRLGFYLALSTEDQGRGKGGENRGDICHVTYFTAVTPDDPDDPEGARSRKLHRLLRASGATLEARREGRAMGRAPDPAQAEAVACNVAKFEVDLLVERRRQTDDGRSRTEALRWDPARFAGLDAGRREEGADDGPAGETVWPRAAVLRLWVAGGRAARMLAREGWEDGEPGGELPAEEELEPFSMRVPLVRP